MGSRKEDFAATALPAGVARMNVTTGAPSISTSALTPTTYRTDARRHRFITTVAIAATAAPCHRKCSKVHPKECSTLAENQFAKLVVITLVIAGSFRARPTSGAIHQFL